MALVTGASKGIGLACMRVLAREGARVVGISRSEANLAAARAALGFAHEASDEFGAAQVRCDEGCGRSQGVLPQSGWRTACLGRRTTRNVLGH